MSVIGEAHQVGVCGQVHPARPLPQVHDGLERVVHDARHLVLPQRIEALVEARAQREAELALGELMGLARRPELQKVVRSDL